MTKTNMNDRQERILQCLKMMEELEMPCHEESLDFELKLAREEEPDTDFCDALELMKSTIVSRRRESKIWMQRALETVKMRNKRVGTLNDD